MSSAAYLALVAGLLVTASMCAPLFWAARDERRHGRSPMLWLALVYVVCVIGGIAIFAIMLELKQ